MQDLGTAQGRATASPVGITTGDWHDVGGGEAGHVVSDPSDPEHRLRRRISRLHHALRPSDPAGAQRQRVAGEPIRHGGEDMRYRFQWTAPIAASPHDPKVVYHGAQVLFRTTDGGQTWTAISPDLTRNDKSKQKWAGGPITGDNTGVETYGTIFAIAESPKQKGLIWAGSDDGLVHVTRDGGKNWTNVTATMPGFPEWGTVSMHRAVAVRRRRPPTSWSTRTGWTTCARTSTRRPTSARRGSASTASLPPDVYLHAVREDPKKRGQLYLGTERGVMYSRDDGENWQPLQLNLPTVAVHDLVVKDDDLVVGTHGRSIWILDDLTPVRAMTDQIRASAGPPLSVDPGRPLALRSSWATRAVSSRIRRRRGDLLLAEGRGEGQ